MDLRRNKGMNAGVLLLVLCLFLAAVICTSVSAVVLPASVQTPDDVNIRIRGGLVIHGIHINVKNNGNTTISVIYNVTHEKLFSDAWSKMSGRYDLGPGDSRESMPGAECFSKVTVTVTAGNTSLTKTGISWIFFTIFFP